MKEVFLCSDRLEKYQPLGENGQAVHISALQLRETLRLRRLGSVADILAIPQVNEQGDRIDWYAPLAGDVIPWPAATESEREMALAQLEVSQAALKRTGEEMVRQPQPEQKLFGSLLSKTLQFPDKNHVYLVDGRPVITFWGFVNARHQARIDPLDCLRPVHAAVTEPTPIMPMMAAAAETAAALPVRRRGFWRLSRLWWLLIPLLLLLLALLLLRGCVPGVSLPGVALPGLESHSTFEPSAASLETRGLTVKGTDSVGVTGNLIGGTTPVMPGEIAASGLADEGQIATANPGVDPAQNEAQSEPAFEPEPNAQAVPPSPEDPTASADPALENSAASPENTDPAKGLVPVDPAAAAGASKAPLTIPPGALSQGSTDFLNGNWHAGAGIQDSRTGKPLSLNYQINQGRGEVQMVRGDGVTCKGSVNAAIQSGQLAINNQGGAKCSDGSVYKMPEILCTPGAQSAADCKGRYDAKNLFPISMKQEASK